MTNEEFKDKMLEFLKTNYPISRIKHNKHFRRGVILDDGEVYFISDPALLLQLQVKLYDIIQLVFDSDEKTTLDVLIKFLHLKL